MADLHSGPCSYFGVSHLQSSYHPNTQVFDAAAITLAFTLPSAFISSLPSLTSTFSLPLLQFLIPGCRFQVTPQH